MSPSMNPFNWFKHKPDPRLLDLRDAVLHAESTKKDTDIEFDGMLGINKFLADDSYLDAHKEGRCYILVPARDDKGKYLIDGENNIQYTKVPDWSELSSREISSHLHAVRFRTPKSAELAKIRIEELFTLKQMNEPERPDYLAKSVYNKAVQMHAIGAIDDSISGRKAKLLKISMKATTVGVREASKKTENEIF